MANYQRKRLRMLMRELTEYEHHVTCKPCDSHFSWNGKAKTTVRYVCKSCGLPMVVENRRKENEES